jgi:hypothetical protein
MNSIQRNHIRIDQSQISQRSFDRAGFPVQHDLTDHPLFSMPRIIKLARSLPQECIEYNAGNLPTGQDPKLTPANGLDPDETIRRIKTCSSWLVLKSVEHDPEYRNLLFACLDSVSDLLEDQCPRMLAPRAFIFVSSPHAVTPFHIDPECQFLLQIRGRKRIQIFDRFDRRVVSDTQLRDFWRGAHRNQPFSSDFNSLGEWHEIAPGTGVHLPVTAPHWVTVMDEVSVSFSVTFETPTSQRVRDEYRSEDICP